MIYQLENKGEGIIMIADHVKCSWCDVEAFIPLGSETCPNCMKNGFLIWVDENEPEVEVDEYRIK